MDLITSAVAAAIARIAHDAPASTTPDFLVDAYQRLKSAIGRLAGASGVLAAIASLEAAPDSTELRLALSKALARARAPEDMATLFAAQALLEQLPRPVAVAAQASVEKSALVSNHAVVTVGFATDTPARPGQACRAGFQ